MTLKEIKYPFPTAAIFLFISSFFYFVNLTLCSELPASASLLTLSCLLRSLGVIALGVFLIVKRVPLGVTISIGALILAQLIEAFTVSGFSGDYLYAEHIGPMFLQNLLVTSALIFTLMLSLINVIKSGFRKFSKVWFIGIIISAIAYIVDFFVTMTISEYFPTEIEDIFIGNFLGNIFLCIAFCLIPRWLRDVLKATEEAEKSDNCAHFVYTTSYMPPYDPYLYLDEQKDNKNL